MGFVETVKNITSTCFFMSLLCFQFENDMYAKNSICRRIFLDKHIIFLIRSYNKLQNLFLFVQANPDPGLQIHL